MKRSLQITGFFIAFCVIATVVSLWDDEPKWEGRKISEWIVELAPGPINANGITEEYVSALKEHQRRRIKAQEAIRGIGSKAVPYLLALIEEQKESQIRAGIEKFFKQLGFEWEKEASGILRHKRAWHGFQTLGPDAVSAIPILLQEWTNSTNGSFAGQIFVAIRPTAITALASGLTNRSLYTRKSTLKCLSELSTNASPALPEIRAMLSDSDPGIRVFASYAYAYVESNRQLAANAIVEIVRETGSIYPMTSAAIRHLAKQVSHPSREFPAITNSLVKCLQADEPGTVAMAINSLSAFSDLAPDVNAAVFNLVESEHAEIRTEVCSFLGTTKYSASTCLPRLADIAKGDPDEDVRDSARQALARYGEISVKYAPALATEIREIIKENRLWDEVLKAMK